MSWAKQRSEKQAGNVDLMTAILLPTMMAFIALQFCSHYPLWRAANLRLTIAGR